jgi:hypothetical protein
MNHPQTIARVFGVLYLITFITSIPAFFVFYAPVLDDPRYIRARSVRRLRPVLPRPYLILPFRDLGGLNNVVYHHDAIPKRSAHSSKVYAHKCVEGRFYELRLCRVL